MAASNGLDVPVDVPGDVSGDESGDVKTFRILQLFS